MSESLTEVICETTERAEEKQDKKQDKLTKSKLGRKVRKRALGEGSMSGISDKAHMVQGDPSIAKGRVVGDSLRKVM